MAERRHHARRRALDRRAGARRPTAFDRRYGTLLSTGDAGQPPAAATLLVAKAGHGASVYTALSLDRQLVAANPGAARLLVNLPAAGTAKGAAR